MTLKKSASWCLSGKKEKVMANFYRDNEDIQFLFSHIDVGKLAEVCEEDFQFASEFDYAPANADEAIQNYSLVLDSLGQLAADFIAPRAEDVDRQGNILNEDGSVTTCRFFFFFHRILLSNSNFFSDYSVSAHRSACPPQALAKH